jgi:hypothetical protein
MGEHRVDQVAARRQPVPGPLPGSDELLEIRPPASARQRQHGRRGGWRRSVRQALATKTGRRVLIGLACVTVLLVGLLAQGFLSSPAPSVPPAAGAVDTSTAVPTSPAPSKAAKKHAAGSTLVSDPAAALRSHFPDNPLNHLHGAGLHQVVISATSREPMTVVGYLVPTGLGSSYGVVKGHPRSWSMSEQALGRGYLAAIFLQTGRDGVPITCTVRVDGKVTNSETTSGGYGRAVCLG